MLAPTHQRLAAYAVWTLAFAPACVSRGSIPYEAYVAAGSRWLAREPLYDLSNIDGFQYFPSAALLFASLTWLPKLLWLGLNWFGYAWGLERLAQRGFLLASLAAVGPAIANLFNGQANLAIAALLLHANAELLTHRSWRASALLAVGIALKPLMVVPALLLATTHARVAIRLAALVPLALAAPLLVRPELYTVSQYADCMQKLALSADPDRLFEDLRGLFTTAGLTLAPIVYKALRAVALVLVLVWARRREPTEVCALASTYLVIFNPRTLSSSYVMPGSYVSLSLAKDRRPWTKIALMLIALAWTLNHHVVHQVEYWVRPLAALVYLVMLVDSPSRAASIGSSSGIERRCWRSQQSE